MKHALYRLILTSSVLCCITFLYSSCSSVDVSQLDPQNYPNENSGNFTFEQDIFPIFSNADVGQRCTNCHFNGTSFNVNGLILEEGNGRTVQTIYDSLFINNGNGIRLNLTSPSASLILSYPAGTSPHVEAFTGGTTNEFYQTILTWIQSGAPF